MDEARRRFIKKSVGVLTAGGLQFPIPADWMGTPKAKPRVVTVFRASQPLNAWLAEHVGPARG